MDDSAPGAMNGAAHDPLRGRSINDLVREQIRGFEAAMAAMEKEAEYSPMTLSLFRVLMPPIIRWRVEQAVAQVNIEDRRDSMVDAVGWVLANELFRPDLNHYGQIGYITQTAALMSVVAMNRIDNRRANEAAIAQAEADGPKPTAPGGHA